MLKYRLISGSLMIAGLCLLTFWESRLTALLMIGVAGMAAAGGLREYFRFTGNMQAPGLPVTTAFAGGVLLVAAGLQGMSPLMRWKLMPVTELAIALLVLVGFIRVFRAQDYAVALRDLGVSALGLIYVVLPLTCMMSVYLHDFPEKTGRALFLFLILVTKFGDIGGYTLGRISNGLMKNGNHKMVPRLSPGKSWEGFVGSLLFSGGMGLFMNDAMGAWALGDGQTLFPIWMAVVIGVLLGAFGLVGDLAESVLKRASGCKDSGGTIPGMGGVMDVIDSVLLVAPAFWVIVRVMEIG